MHNALTDMVSLVYMYSASLGRGGGGSDQTPHAVWCPLRLWAPGL